MITVPCLGLQIFNHLPDFSQKVQGFANEVDPEYDSNLFRKLQEALLDCREKNLTVNENTRRLLN